MFFHLYFLLPTSSQSFFKINNYFSKDSQLKQKQPGNIHYIQNGVRCFLIFSFRNIAPAEASLWENVAIYSRSAMAVSPKGMPRQALFYAVLIFYNNGTSPRFLFRLIKK